MRLRPKRPILRGQLAAANPTTPQYYPHFRAQRRADAPVTMYLQSSNGTKQPLDPNSTQGMQLAAEVRRRRSIVGGFGPTGTPGWTLCLPMPTPNDPGNRACAVIPGEAPY